LVAAPAIPIRASNEISSSGFTPAVGPPPMSTGEARRRVGRIIQGGKQDE
jgi:hypothetical protein